MSKIATFDTIFEDQSKKAKHLDQHKTNTQLTEYCNNVIVL